MLQSAALVCPVPQCGWLPALDVSGVQHGGFATGPARGASGRADYQAAFAIIVMAICPLHGAYVNESAVTEPGRAIRGEAPPGPQPLRALTAGVSYYRQAWQDAEVAEDADVQHLRDRRRERSIKQALVNRPALLAERLG